MVTISFDTRQVQSLAKNASLFVKTRAVPIAASVLVKQIKVLSQQQGVDYMGRPFKRYTPRYAAYKKRKGKAVDKVNLTFSGKFMNSVGYAPEMSMVTVREDLQSQAEGLDKKRKIWGVHPDSIRLIENALVTEFNNTVHA